MKQKRYTDFIILLILIIFLSATELLVAQLKITSSVMSSGGSMQSGGNYSIIGTAGQVLTGGSAGTNSQLYTGFWHEYQVLTPVNDDAMPPIEFKLEQNYPNPFNPTTVIRFAVPEKSNVLIKVYEIIGSELTTLVDEEMQPGWYQRTFNAAGYASGVYIFRMEAGSYISTKKMLLVK